MRKLLLLVLCVCTCSVFAGTARQENYSGKSVYTLENDKLILRIDPANGGKAISFYLKERKQELVVPEKDEGFFIDHWSKYLYPSGLMYLAYQPEIVKLKDGVALKLSLTVPAQGGGQGARNKVSSLKIPTEKELVGLQIIKTIILKDGKDFVKVNMELKNPSNDSKAGAFHFQHGFRITPGNNQYRWDIPSTEGIVGPAAKPGIKPTGKQFINDPVSGWLSVSDLNGFNIVFEFDYNYLDRTYSCGITGEWMMENYLLSAGKSFHTEYFIYPADGFERITFAKNGIIAGIRADETAKGFRINTDLISKAKEYKGLSLDLKVISRTNKNVIAEKKFAVGALSGKRKTFTLDVPHKEEIVIKAVLSGKNMNESFEYHYRDEKTEYNRRFFYGTISQGAAALAGGRGSAYRVKAPAKIKKMDLPDFSRIKKFPGDKNRMLVLFGLYTDHLKIYETFRHDSNTEISWCNAHPRGATGFPAAFEDLFRYKTIFMCNVSYKSLRFEGYEMLRHWIDQGGTLVITGGFYTYGAGEFEGTPFLDYVPLKNLKPFDLAWAGGKDKTYDLKVIGKHPVLEGVDFSSAPEVAWLHRLEAKPGAQVLAAAGGYPAIVTMKYGKGTVIACTMAPMGKPGKPFWLGDGWKKFLINCSRINKN